ncbi:MAG: preprotein translocase subunit SecE [Proteocatella sp.]
MQTEANKKFSLGKFLSEVRAEMKKVHWPTKKEMLSYTTTVILTVVVIAVFIYGIDSSFGFILGKILGN